MRSFHSSDHHSYNHFQFVQVDKWRIVFLMNKKKDTSNNGVDSTLPQNFSSFEDAVTEGETTMRAARLYKRVINVSNIHNWIAIYL